MRILLSILLLSTLAAGFSAPPPFRAAVYYETPGSGGLVAGEVSADFNHDGWMDLAVVETASNKVFVLLNQMNGTFSVGPTIQVPSGTGAVAAGDLNEDGNPDLVTVTAVDGASGSILIFLGNGDGTFTRGNRYRVGEAPYQAVITDFPGDGHVDVAVTNSLQGGIMVFAGDGHGALGNPVRYSAPRGPQTMAAADVNGDHHPDLLVVGKAGTLLVLLNHGDGTFTKGQSAAVDKDVLSMAVADLNHDGNLDVIVSSGFTNQLEVLLGSGDGTFQAAGGHYNVLGDARGFVVEDFNLDGILDVAAVTQSNGISLFYGNGDGTFQMAIWVFFQGGGGNAIASSDFDMDGAPDLAVSTTPGRVAVLMNAK